MTSARLLSLIFVFVITLSSASGSESWPCYGHAASRSSIAVDGPDKIDSATLAWVADADPQDPNYYVQFESATGPVVYNGRVYAYAKYLEPNEQSPTGFDYTHSQIVAYDANSGELLWATAIDKAVWDSWSTPCVDTRHNMILVASGDKVFCLDAVSGIQQWTTQLEKIVINASVCTAVDIPHGRAFITDYDGFGSSGKLYCINLDPNEPANPYQPGQIVWSDTLGSTSGSTPAYRDGVVYVATIAGTANSSGTIYAYDATATDNPVKLWQSTEPNLEAFTGGVTVTREGFLYAATYDWAQETEDNSTLVKIDCNDGSIVWTVPTERTSTMPVVVGEKIYISGGIADDPPHFAGSRPKVSAYQDLGTSAVKLWESPAGLGVGGWMKQPAYANGKLYVGSAPEHGDYFGMYSHLYIIDVTLEPEDEGFIIDRYRDKYCGSSPAVTCDSLYTTGYDGLFKFHQSALLADVTKDGGVDFLDLAKIKSEWLFDGAVGVNRCDLDLDGRVNMSDFSLFADSWH